MFSDMSMSEPKSVSEVMTLPESMSESVSKVQKIVRVCVYRIDAENIETETGQTIFE